MNYQVGQSYGLSTAFDVPDTEPAAKSTGRSRTPFVWHVYFFYCIAMSLLYVGLTIGSALFALNVEEWSTMVESNLTLEQLEIVGWISCGISFVFASAFAVGATSKSGTSGWILGLVLITFGLSGLCTLPFSIFMLIAWCGKKTRAFFRPPTTNMGFGQLS